MEKLRLGQNLSLFKVRWTHSYSTVVTYFVAFFFMLNISILPSQNAYAQPSVCQDVFQIRAKTTPMDLSRKESPKGSPTLMQKFYFQIALKELQLSLWTKTSFNILKYSDLSADQYFFLAKLFAEKGKLENKKISQNIYFQRLSSDGLYEIAKIIAARNPIIYMNHIDHFKTLTNDQLFEVVKIIVSRMDIYRSSQLKYIMSSFQHYLNTDQLFEIAKIMAAQQGQSIAIQMRLERFKGLSNEQVFEIAKVAVNKDVYAVSTLARTTDFYTPTKSQSLQLMKIAIRNATTTRDQNRISSLLRELNFESSVVLMANKFLNFLYPFNHEEALPGGFKAYIKNDRSISEDILDIHSIAELKEYFSSYFAQTKLPHLKNNMNIMDMAWDRIQKRETGLLLIEHALQLVARGKPVPQTSLALLAKVSGLKLDLLPTKISTDTLGKIYELALDIQNRLYGPFFSHIEIAPEIYKKPVLLIEILSAIRDYKALNGNGKEGGLAALAFVKNQKLDAGNLDAIAKTIQQAVIDKVQSLLDSQNLNITYEKLKKLEEAWGNLDPIFTLVARFNGNDNWKSLIPELAEIFEADLNREFKNYKFFGSSKDTNDQQRAQKQLSSFKTKAAKLGWMKPRAIVNIAKDSKNGLNEIEILSNVRSIFTKNLLPHLKLKPKDLTAKNGYLEIVLSTQAGVKEIYEQLILKFELDRSNPMTHVNILKEVLSGYEGFNLKEIPKIVKFLQLLISKDATLVETDLKEQVAEDLTSIIKSLNILPQQSAAAQSLVLSVINSDAKFLMTIGDLVKTSSCQNYRTGSYIETLLGYVKDANIQGMASFSLESTQFKTATDFDTVYRAYQNGNTPTVSFDGNLLVATFSLQNGIKIQTNSLEGKAYLRQIVKSGENIKTGQSAIFLESEYMQNHSSMLQMKDQHQELLGIVLKATDSTNIGPIYIIGSRNSQGHYSDAAGGIMKENYKVSP